MSREGYAALVVDLDGTLIGRDQRISPTVEAAVRDVAGRLSVSIASGREPSDVLRFARQLGLTAPQISDNGALLLDPANGEALWSSPLLPAQSREIIGSLRREEVAFIATHPGGTFTHACDIDRWDLARVSALDMEEETADRLAELFGADPGLNVVKVTLPYNGLWAVDLTRAGVNKGTAVHEVARLLGIPTRQMIAVGDSYNDLPLLEACGLGIAMGNAAPELKAVAGYVAPSVDDDGLAVAIEEFVLPRL
ncbi:MAG: HAD family phosphatase [Chloroflexi bacterium]|nr:HAD family phosphatase [Chloroflexota bacterium]